MSDTKPNILFIITDHQAFYGHHRPGEYEYAWPHFEKFASQGTRFDRAYAVCPLCTPARASMMTGVYPSAHGLRWNTGANWKGNRNEFREDQRLYCHYLADAGYENGYVGKWHCGAEKLPADYGAAGWALPDYGKPYMSDAYKRYASERGLGDATADIEYHAGRPEWEGTSQVLHDPSPWTFMDATGMLQGPPEAHEIDFTSHLCSEKLRELAGNGEPWSLVASFWGPHQPFYPTEPFASMVDPSSIPEYPSFRDNLEGRPLRYFLHRKYHHAGSRRWRDWSDWQRMLAKVYGQGYQLDTAIGRLLEALDATGQAENTMVIWCADHGDAAASHGGLWDKASTYIEEVARIPMAVRWPATLPGGQRTDALVTNMDVTATMLEAAGAEIPEDMHSRSVLPLCRDAGADWPGHIIAEHNGHGEDILQRIVVTDRYKYVAALYDGDELYDLKEDPFEMTNLIDSTDHEDVRKDLRTRIIEHIETSGDPIAGRLAYSLGQGFA